MTGDPQLTPSTPWRAGDVLSASVLYSVSSVLLVAAWWGASSTSDLGRQVWWLNVAVAGVIVEGAAVSVWLMSGRRAAGQRRRELFADIPPVRSETEYATDVPDDMRTVTAPRMTRYHRATCGLVVGKPYDAAPVEQHRAAGLAPCGVCRPDGSSGERS